MIEGVDYTQRYFEDVTAGQEIPAVSDEITYRRVIMNPATTWDYFPGHHDPEYARSQGQPTIYLNTMHLLGFVDRVITDWSGPRTFLVRRKVKTHQSVYAGDTIVGTGRVVTTRDDERAGRTRHLVDLELTVANQNDILCVSATATVALPSRADGERSRPWW